MHKPQILLFKRFASRLTEENNYLTLFPGSIEAKKMAPEDLNNILLHIIPNGREKQSYLQGWEFKRKTHKETYNMFNRMEITKQVYADINPNLLYEHYHQIILNKIEGRENLNHEEYVEDENYTM